ncbi:uncharacterized protein A4U43_C03F12100 [Asparagus officinalis]|uniref:Uncharacterized protein n=1 Tax=Asparagus officinalis TaxID=4686 RepID=A0A5P1FB57_ASPOF|nr:uncharacterized protein A4U43_C03F12100 [Asparagus officinalis]
MPLAVAAPSAASADWISKSTDRRSTSPRLRGGRARGRPGRRRRALADGLVEASARGLDRIAPSLLFLIVFFFLDLIVVGSPSGKLVQIEHAPSVPLDSKDHRGGFIGACGGSCCDGSSPSMVEALALHQGACFAKHIYGRLYSGV